MSLFDKLKGLLGGKVPSEPPPEPEEAASMASSHDAGDHEESAGDEEEEDDDEVDEEPESRQRWSKADDADLEREARALFAGGDAPGALALLRKKGLLLARHDAGPVPCLCRKCLVPEADAAAHGGVPFVRDFVVARRRVLFYWMPAELGADAKQVRASMRAAIEDPRPAPDAGAAGPRTVINPFTKQSVVLPPKVPRLHVNPLTGKPLPRAARR